MNKYLISKAIRRAPYKKPSLRKIPRARTNFEIRYPEIRVVSEDGQQLGIMRPQEAIRLAQEASLDLVEIAPTAKPPVCRIMDYGKFQYQKSRQDRLSKSKQKKTEVKGIRIGLKTDNHDLNFKKNQAEKFLKKGHKIKVEIMLRGREKAHQDLAKENLQKFISTITEPKKIEQEIKKYPAGFNAIIAPESNPQK